MPKLKFSIFKFNIQKFEGPQTPQKSHFEKLKNMLLFFFVFRFFCFLFFPPFFPPPPRRTHVPEGRFF